MLAAAARVERLSRNHQGRDHTTSGVFARTIQTELAPANACG